jgi:putative DNA primase/helicase
VSANGGEAYVKRQIEKAINATEPTDSADKQIIRIISGNLHEAWRATERALIRAQCPVYVRGGFLVQPLWRWEKSSEKNRDTLVSAFVKLNVPRLRDITARHAVVFQKWDARLREYKNIDPPNDVIETLLEVGHWGFPSVVGIVNSPTMRPDGTILTAPGYDVATHLWHKPAADIELPTIPEKPSKEEAKAALELLCKLLVGFPFVADLDKSVAVSAILTVVLRGAFEIAPLFFFRAPEAGTGKTYLVKVISTIATGRGAASVVGTKDNIEMTKQLSAAAFEAMPILNLNNLTFDLENALLASMVTDGIVGIRPFGKNDQLIPCDCRGTTLFANGNNIRIVGDLVRRTLTVRMDAKQEQPETRTFNFDPVAHALKDRGAYLAAAFTIARAYMAAGGSVPKDTFNVAGFEEWSRFVRYPLVWLGMTDPALSMQEARSIDPDRIAFGERISALTKCFGADKHFTAADVHSRANEAVHQDLFSAFSRDGKNISAKSIGNQLMRDRGRVSRGYHVEIVAQDDKTSNTYMLVKDDKKDASPKNDSDEPPM